MAVQEKFDLVIRAKDEATVTLKKVNREVDQLSTGGVPRFTSSMSSYTREAIKADLKSAALGSRLAGLSPAVGQLSNAFMIGNPIVAAAAFGIGMLSAEIVDAITAHQQEMKAITDHRSSLNCHTVSTGSAGVAGWTAAAAGEAAGGSVAFTRDGRRSLVKTRAAWFNGPPEQENQHRHQAPDQVSLFHRHYSFL